MEKSRFITPFDGHVPTLGKAVFVDISARIIGRVTLEQGASVWPGAVIRADDDAILVASGSAVLDLGLVEAPEGRPVRIGPDALVSHGARVHGATIRAGALVGIGAIVLDGAVIGEGALVAAGAIVPPNMEIAAGMLAMGQPAKAIRPLTPPERETIASQIRQIQAKARRYLEMAESDTSGSPLPRKKIPG